MKRLVYFNRLTFFTILVYLFMISCNKTIYREATTDEVNIAGFFDNNSETFSLFTDMLTKAKAYGFLSAYGTYTVFAPTNDAVNSWIKDKGKNSLNDFQDSELNTFVRYHIIRDTVASLRFTDGKIKTPTLIGEFLYTDVLNGVARVNKSALITQMNIQCGNGIVHTINKVLVPPAKSLAETIESNPRYSIFTQALKATGFYDTLYFERGQTVTAEKRFQTAIVESDSVFNAEGIADFNALKAKYSQTGDPKNPSDSLWLYVAYHLSNGGNYLEDVAGLGTLYTLAPKEIVNTKLMRTKVLLNDAVFNGIYEPGAELNRAQSDVTASNGVLHESLHTFSIMLRVQVPVYFDVATSPELLTALGSSYRNAGKPLVENGAPIANSISFENYTVLTIGSNKYDYTTSTGVTRAYANGDWLNLSVCTNNAARVKYFDLKTPYLVKGRYKVWICYAQNSSAPDFQVVFNPGKEDEQILPNIVFFSQYLTASGVANNLAGLGSDNADNLMLAQGYKRYMATVGDYNPGGVVGGIKPKFGNDGHANVGRLAGTIDVETTDRHIIRLKTVSGTKCASNSVWLDMIQFIPADDIEQIYPRFHPVPGALFYRPQ
ncbi:MAG: fasciclin domain-containing protein [Sphingobacteriales bacterium]|nr:fasciclin domain-containing protein [Sphingobacteriales bacterium]